MEKQKKKTFGEIAIAKGYITEETLDMAIVNQKRFQSSGRYPLIGVVLLKMGKITSAQLMEIILEMGKA